MVVLRMFVRGIGLVSTIILARLLVPADFGVIALAMSLYAVIDILGAFNFETAIIQTQRTERAYYDTGWTLNVIYGVFAAALLVALAKPAALFFNETRITDVIYVLAAIAFITRIENIGILEFRRELQMSKLFWLQVTRKLASFLATVTLAIIYKSYWALVAGMVVGALVRVVSTFVVHPYRPRFSIEKTRELFGFSKWVLVSSIFTFINRKADDLAVGKFLGVGPLGIYTIAYELSNLTATELVAPITHALFPGYSKVASEPVALKWYYLRTVSVMALIAFPVAGGIALVADDLVKVVLGEKWIAAVPVIHVLAANGAIAATFAPNGSVQMALGRPRVNATFQAVRAVLLVMMLLLLVPTYGLMAAAWAQFAVTWIIVPASTYVVAKELQLSKHDIRRAIWRPALASAFMGIAVAVSNRFWIGLPPSVALLGQAMIGAVSYGFVVYVLWRMTGSPNGAEGYLLDRLRSMSGRFAHS